MVSKVHTVDIPPSEINRKLLHLFASVIPLIYLMISQCYAKWIMLALTVGYLVLDTVRLEWRWLYKLFKPFIRKEERRGLTAGVMVFIASTILFWTAPKPYTVIALFYISIGDTAAAWVGMKWGRLRWLPKRTVEGSLACLLANTLVACIAAFGFSYLPFLPMFIGAVVATLVEAFASPWKWISGVRREGFVMLLDDNLLLPLLSTVAMVIADTVI